MTPSEIFALALKRHRKPWNWTLHFVGLIGFGLTLLLHSYLMFATSLILFGAGSFDLQLPVTSDNRWLRFVAKAIEWEKDWVAAPWNWYKTRRFLFVLAVVFVSIWALWTRDGVVLCLLVAFAYLLKVMKENIAGGIDP